MARRGNNIYKRKDGRYEGRIPVGYRDDGSIRYKSVYAHTLAEVKQKMAEIYAVGQEQHTSAAKVKFQDVAEQWLLSAKLRVKPSSYANYQNIVNKHLLPELGVFYMSALTSGKVNDFILKKLNSGRLSGKGGLSAKSVRDIMTVFRSISVYAEREYGIRVVHFTMPKECKPIDALQSVLPAGTLSGAPKVRAMEIIDELENKKRGLYGGTVGYFGYNGDMNTCIAIRTVLFRDGKAYIQAGAGIVADSDPEKEFEETTHKAGAVLNAIIERK